MKLYYFSQSANFGDSLNSWLWQRLLPDRWDPADDICFSGIGTIINANMPASPRWIVFTSGVGYGGPPPHFGDRNWNVLSVRGPLSAAVLGLPPTAAVTDGALLLATLPEFAPLAAADREGVVFVPHFEAAEGALWPEACRRAGIEYLNPLDDSRAVVRRIRRARLVIAEAMHAAIVADAVRVPWIAMVSSPQISTFKWLDWTAPMELPYRPLPLRASSARSQLRNAMLWAYDRTHRFAEHSERAAVAYYRRRYQGQNAATRTKVLARRMHRRAERWLLSPRLASARGRWDEMRIDRAADDLAQAAQNAGMLSHDRVHAARVDALASRLERLQ